MPDNARSKLKPRQMRAVYAYLEQPTITKAATQAAVHERTLRRWLATDIFNRALDDARREAYADGLARLQAGASEAIEALRALVRDGSLKPSDKIAAIRTYLDHAHRAEESLDLRGAAGGGVPLIALRTRAEP